MLISKSISAALLLSAALLSADPFVGSWKLNIDKSNLRDSNVTGGRTTYQPIGTGYVYDAEIVFTNGKTARLHGPIAFDGTANGARLDGRPVTFVSKKLYGNSYELVIADEQTGTKTNIFRYTVEADTLTFQWLDGTDRPELILVYDRE